MRLRSLICTVVDKLDGPCSAGAAAAASLQPITLSARADGAAWRGRCRSVLHSALLYLVFVLLAPSLLICFIVLILLFYTWRECAVHVFLFLVQQPPSILLILALLSIFLVVLILSPAFFFFLFLFLLFVLLRSSPRHGVHVGWSVQYGRIQHGRHGSEC